MSRPAVPDRSRDRETVLPSLLDRLRAQVPCDRAQVMVVEDGSRLSVRALFDGERVVSLPAGERPEIDASGHPVLREALSGGEAVVVADVRTHAGWSPPAEPTAEVSWMGVPLFAGGEVAGLLTLSRREADPFEEEHVRLAETVAAQASLAIENAILHEQVEASKARLRTLPSASSKRRSASAATSRGSCTTRRARPWRRCASGSASWSGRRPRAVPSPPTWRTSSGPPTP